MSVYIENWSVCTLFAGNQLQGSCLVGIVYGHPRHENGKRVSTSQIVSCVGRLVTTRSGTQYELGAVDPEYMQYLTQTGITYDPDQPIRVRMEQTT